MWEVRESQVWEVVALGRHWRFSWKQQAAPACCGFALHGARLAVLGRPGVAPAAMISYKQADWKPQIAERDHQGSEDAERDGQGSLGQGQVWGEGSKGLCRFQVRKCEPPVLPEPVWLSPLVQVRLGGILLQEDARGFAGGLPTPVLSLLLPSAGAPCTPATRSAQAGGLLAPLGSTGLP